MSVSDRGRSTKRRSATGGRTRIRWALASMPVDVVLRYIDRLDDALARYRAVVGGDDRLPIHLD